MTQKDTDSSADDPYTIAQKWVDGYAKAETALGHPPALSEDLTLALTLARQLVADKEMVAKARGVLDAAQAWCDAPSDSHTVEMNRAVREYRAAGGK